MTRASSNMRNHIATAVWSHPVGDLVYPQSVAASTIAFELGVEVARSRIETDKGEEGAPAPEGRTVAGPVMGPRLAAGSRWCCRRTRRGLRRAVTSWRCLFEIVKAELRTPVQPAEPSQAPRPVHLAGATRGARSEPADDRYKFLPERIWLRQPAGGAAASPRGAGSSIAAADPKPSPRRARGRGQPEALSASRCATGWGSRIHRRDRGICV